MTTEVVKAETKTVTAPDIMDDVVQVEKIVAQLQLISHVMQSIMRPGVHYGQIPGARTPSLWQPGADVINRLFKLRPEFEVVSAVRQADFLGYVVKCSLFHRTSGELWGTALAACNTREVKYESTLKTRKCSPYELENTMFQMACKRAKVAACKNSTAASELFSFPEEGPEDEPEAQREEAPSGDQYRGRGKMNPGAPREAGQEG